LADSTTTPEWKAVCSAMESEFRDQRFEIGAVNGIHAVNNILIHHFRSCAGTPI
jgi:uncharacterized membrane protein